MYTILGDVTVDIQAGARISDFQKMWERKVIKQVRGIKINVLSIEDLIETKKHTGRSKDKEDIRVLGKILNKEI
ncbi:nucleotidyltransferase [candidate division WOR-3 bacterium]|nr:nucleotidyltransferase [candidate division WOR-3 bacterium]